MLSQRLFVKNAALHCEYCDDYDAARCAEAHTNHDPPSGVGCGYSGVRRGRSKNELTVSCRIASNWALIAVRASPHVAAVDAVGTSKLRKALPAIGRSVETRWANIAKWTFPRIETFHALRGLMIGKALIAV